MPLILHPAALSSRVLKELRKSLRDDLAETAELVHHPAGKVRDPASLETASELIRSALARLDLPSPRSPEALGADVNLAYATLVAVIDLVKSHTDVPRVPRRRAPQ